jgi:microcompartment protein CcmL/EutN
VPEAIALLEFDSVAAGILAGDAMVKRGPVAEVVTGTVHPGRYLVLVTGDVAAVHEAVDAGRAASLASIVDQVVLPDVHPTVVDAIRGGRRSPAGEALGVIETTTVAAVIEAADAGVKGAEVSLLELHLADGLGGKAYALFSGSVSDVEVAVAGGVARIAPDRLVGSVVISRLHDELGDNIFDAHRFGDRLGWFGGHDAAG